MSSIESTVWQDVGSKGIWWLHPMELPLIEASMASLLSQLCSLLPIFLRLSSFLASPNFWGFYSTFAFILIVSCTSLSGLHCLVFQAFYWNLGRSLPDHTVLAFCVNIKQVLHAWIQCLPIVEAVARLPSFLAVGIQYLWIKSEGKISVGCCHSGTWFYRDFFSKQSFHFEILRLQMEFC